MMRLGCAVAFLSIAVIALTGVIVGTHNSEPVRYGDPQRGHVLMNAYGCMACHAERHAGPELTHMARRGYIAGRFPNIQIWMIAWIEHPQRLKRGTAMPDLGVNERDARDMAAYLATLR
jgi:cytochrome c2